MYNVDFKKIEYSCYQWDLQELNKQILNLSTAVSTK